MMLRRPVRVSAAALALASFCCLIACHEIPQQQAGPEVGQRGSEVRDLLQAEAAGGHTLERHIGRSDEELRNRLAREPDISAASTFTDRETAERVVGTVLQQNQARIERWLQRPAGHANLVLDYRGPSSHPIGRTLRRASAFAEPCSDAIVVLRWDGGRQYHVLTTYPECR